MPSIDKMTTLGCLPFDRKFWKFRMEGKWSGNFSEIPTENWGVRFEVVRSFRFVQTKRNVVYHQPISRFLLGSRLTLHKFALFLDSNRNGCSNSAVNWYIAYHYAFDSPNGFFCQMVSTPEHTSLERWISFNCCIKCTVLWIWLNHWTRKLTCLLHSYKLRLIALLGPFTDCKDRFFSRFKYLNQWNPNPFIYLNEKAVPALGRSLR